MRRRWRVDLGGKLSAPVIARGHLYVAQIERHTLHAIDARSGKRAWSYTAGGRIDSPPTIYRERVLFGCADGCIYALRASDGGLSWRFRAAPVERRIVSYGQLESAWPLHGSVLVQDDCLYAVAGRSMFLDGGLRLLKLDAVTGALLIDKVLDEKLPGTDDSLQTAIKGHNIPVALPDILSSDGAHLFMRTQQFDLDGNRVEVAPLSANQVVQAANQAGPLHLFSPIGFLDGSWWHRAYWVYGSRFAMGAGGYSQAGKFAPAGRILAMNESGVYGYGREPGYFTWTTPLEYRLFGAEKQLKQRRVPIGRARRGKERKTIPGTAPVVRWSGAVPLQVRGMVLTPGLLFTAGPPDVVDEAKAFHRLGRPTVQKALARQSAALKGREGAILYAAGVRDGRRVTAYQLASPPVWDGLAAAHGQLFLAALDGTVSCLGDTGAELPSFRAPEPDYKQPDLVGYWTFNEGKGSLAADSSERCNDALVRTQWADGKSGACVRFSKPNDSVQIPDAECLNLTDAMTIVAWIKPDEQTAKIPMIVSKLGFAGRYIFRLTTARHLVALVWKGDERVATIQSDQPLSKDWHCVTVTCDARETKRMRLYVDGELVKEQPIEREWGDPAGKPLSISGRGNQQYKGLVDEVRIYNRVLSPHEIRKLAQTGAAAATR